MPSATVGIRELKSRLSYYLQQVKAGDTLIITEHNRPIGKIVPTNLAIDERLQALVEAGLVVWNGKPLAAIDPVATTRGSRTVADLLVEDRE
jgi:prevent-host-death family protein